MAKLGSAQDFLQIPAKNFRPEASATAPAAPVPGQMWTDTSVSPAKLRWYDGTNWIASDGTSIPTGFITDALISPTANIALSKLAVNPLARANHTGTQLAATISDFDAQVRTTRLDQHAAPTATVDFNGQRLANVGSPTNASDGVNKAYVDNSRAGISVKDPVRVATSTNINLAAPGASIDGIALVAGDRFLAANQTTGTQNGLYVWNGASATATRTSDADAAGEVFDGSMVAVAEGTDAGKQYIQTATASGAPGSWTQSWLIYSTGGQTYTAGNGLTLTGTTFALFSPVALANGGTGATTVAGAKTALGFTGKFAQTQPTAWTAGVTYNITHSMSTTDVVVNFLTVADNRVIQLDWAVGSAAHINVYPDYNFAANSVRVVIIG